MELIKYNACWADEFDIMNISLHKDGTFQDLIKRVHELFEKSDEENLEFGFGTNEWIDYSSADCLLSDLSMVSIPEQEADIIKEYIGNDYGMMNIVDRVGDMSHDYS